MCEAKAIETNLDGLTRCEMSGQNITYLLYKYKLMYRRYPKSLKWPFVGDIQPIR